MKYSVRNNEGVGALCATLNRGVDDMAMSIAHVRAGREKNRAGSHREKLCGRIMAAR